MLRSVPQLFVMTAIVTTALFVPVAALLALAAMAFGIPLESFATFGGSLGPVAGVFAWWAIFFAPALVYAAYMMPWSGRD